MNNIYHKIITGGFALVLAGAVAFTAAPMDAQASAALGISSQIGLSADMDAAETTDVENAMNQTVLDAFHLDGYSNLGIVTVSEGKVNIRDSASTDGKIVGKIGNNAGCDVLGEEGEWLQIKSGKVEGYIKAECAHRKRSTGESRFSAEDSSRCEHRRPEGSHPAEH